MQRQVAALLGMTLAAASTAQPVLGALEIAVSVSPELGTVGRPIEVMVRTFEPIGGEDVSLPVPSMAYPAPSGHWDVLYPIPDYPFDVVARPRTGDIVSVTLSRDPADASLWRGSFTPTIGGDWLVTVRNFPTVAPIRVPVIQAVDTRYDAWVAVLALVIGLGLGLAFGLFARTRRGAIS